MNVKAEKVSEAAQTVAYCTDLQDLIQHVKEKRKHSEVHLKLGIDCGDFLKVCLSIQSTT